MHNVEKWSNMYEHRKIVKVNLEAIFQHYA